MLLATNHPLKDAKHKSGENAVSDTRVVQNSSKSLMLKAKKVVTTPSSKK
jgi:hypothetical protein